MAPGIGIGIGIGRGGGGTNWSSYWTTQLTPVIEKQYYWWDNVTGASRNINITHKFPSQNYGLTYKIGKVTDDFYEIWHITHDKLVGRYWGDKATASFTNNNAYSIGDSANVDTLTFNGTQLSLMAYKYTNKGICRFILFDGTLRGYLVVGINGPNAVNADKAAGRYYVVMAAGNYANIDASMDALNKYDLIYYTGSVWQIYTQAQYNYIDIDFYYNGGNTLTEFSLFTGMAAATYKLGVLPLYEKNASSSAYGIVLSNTASFDGRSYRVEGGTSINYGVTQVELVPSSPPHLHMATTIKKAGSAETVGWLPQHGGAEGLCKMVYDVGADMQNWVDGVEITGNNAAYRPFIECAEYKLTNVAFAVHTDNEAEHLLEMTAEYTVTVNGFNSKIKYDTLINTYIGTGYAVQLPWLANVWNKFVSDLPEELDIPGNLATTNITSGQSRSNIMIYNATPASSVENIFISYNIPSLATTYRGKTNQCFLYNMGSNIGKAYLPGASDETFAAGTVWNTEMTIKAGYIADLINKVAAFIV